MYGITTINVRVAYTMIPSHDFPGSVLIALGFDEANSNLDNINGKLSSIDTKLDIMHSKLWTANLGQLERHYNKLTKNCLNTQPDTLVTEHCALD
jgi:hypothetical protein